jgi:hypothetical protein
MTTIDISRSRRRQLAQAGLAARALLYATIGVLAVQIALQGGGGEQASQSGALRSLAQEGAWGTFLVGLLGFGLAGYALWRLSQFFIEKGDDEDSEAKKWVMRISYLVRAVIYAGLSVLAFTIAFGSSGGGGGGGGSGTQTMTARVMDAPGGRWLVGLVGLIIIGVGLYQAYKAYTGDFMEELRTEQMHPQERRWVHRLGIAGHSARAVAFSIIGFFVTLAAVQFDPQEAVGLDGALQRLARQPYGPWLLLLVALGLFAYGVYQAARVRYVDVSE